MASSTNKRVVAIRFDREPVSGFVNPQTFMRPDGVELLTVSGSVAVVPYTDLKALCFVRDAGMSDPWKPNLFFSSRPKTEGLWTRFTFRDGDRVDGVLPGNLLALESEGFTITPPDVGLSVTRMFLPKQALTGVEVLGVIGAAAKRSRVPKPVPADQLKMFD